MLFRGWSPFHELCSVGCPPHVLVGFPCPVSLHRTFLLVFLVRYLCFFAVGLLCSLVVLAFLSLCFGCFSLSSCAVCITVLSPRESQKFAIFKRVAWGPANSGKRGTPMWFPRTTLSRKRWYHESPPYLKKRTRTTNRAQTNVIRKRRHEFAGHSRIAP